MLTGPGVGYEKTCESMIRTRNFSAPPLPFCPTTVVGIVSRRTNAVSKAFMRQSLRRNTGIVGVNRRSHKFAPFIRPGANETCAMGICRQLSTVPTTSLLRQMEGVYMPFPIYCRYIEHSVHHCGRRKIPFAARVLPQGNSSLRVQGNQVGVKRP